VSDSAARDEADDDRVVRILLVEDVLPLLELQKSYLKRTTCRVLTARTGSQALKLCRRDPPDLVFLDAAMPDIDGLAACRFLKADPLAGRVPVVLIASPERREECARAGCDGVLIKPFDSSAFLDVVRRFVPLLERRESRIPVSCRVEFSSRVGSYTAYTRDLSAHGLFLKSPRPFALGTRLRMLIHLPVPRGQAPAEKPAPLPVEGEVRRILRPSPVKHLLAGIGVRFVDAPAGTLRAIEEFIAVRRSR
jgi:CheY-like chemotaxis protein/Tfp pilus assembly protein PilZ